MSHFDVTMPTIAQVVTSAGLARWQEHVADCYQKLGFLSPEDCPEGRAADTYDQHSTHFSVLNAEGGVVGTFRFVPYYENSQWPMSATLDLSRIQEKERYFELTRLTTDRMGGFLTGLKGSSSVFRSQLFHAACYGMTFARQKNLDGFVAIIDLSMFDAFNRRFSNTLQPIEGFTPTYYDGGWVLPVRLRVSDWEEKVAGEDSKIKDYLQSIQLDPVTH